MANTKNAKKMIKVNERRRKRNQSIRTTIKTAFKKATQALEAGEASDAADAARKAASAIDRAVSKGTVHRNTAARKKSRLMKKVNALA
ncbi:MAG: 30S ribosomal protein S20 [Candidatus Eremiobacteraeota bacterium]|nr:30S ribosomal protein S20 [Candidatus Eremiobacteraeota bacterium]